MLVLTRQLGEAIVLGEAGEVKLTVISVRGKQVKVGIEAHPSIPVHRDEIYQLIQKQLKKKKAMKSKKNKVQDRSGKSDESSKGT